MITQTVLNIIQWTFYKSIKDAELGTVKAIDSLLNKKKRLQK